MKQIVISLLLLLTVSPSHAGIDVIQTISYPDKINTVLKNSLNAGDTITIQIRDWDSDLVVNKGTQKFSYKSEEYEIKLDLNYFSPSPTGYEYCKSLTGDEIKTCVQSKFFVVSDYAHYSVLELKNITTKETVKTRPVVNTGSNWSLNVSGGFVSSKLTSPKYYAKEIPNEVDPTSTSQVAARNRSAEDDLSLGMAAFVHTCNESWRDTWYWSIIRPRCISFGLGLSDQSGDLNFLPGLTWRLGQESFFTIGAQMAKIDALPRGLSEGDKISSANDLATLDSRYETKLFLSFSYQFLGGNTKQNFSSQLTPPKQ